MSKRPLTKADLAAQAIARAMPTPVHLDYTYWTNKEEAALRDFHAQGLSYTRIAAKMKCSRNAIAGKCYRLGLVRH